MAETKIIYHIDEEETPYLVKIPIAAENITLLDFKQVLNKPNYKFFFKSMDQDFGVVKEEIPDDGAKLPCFNGRVVSWVGNERSTDPNATGSVETLDEQTETESVVSFRRERPRHREAMDAHAPRMNGQSRLERHLAGYESSSTVMSSELETTSFCDSEDDDTMSRFSSATEQSTASRLLKRHRRRRKQRPPRLERVLTKLSNTQKYNFLGISIVGQSNERGDGGIYIGSIMKGGAVAADGRIEPGDMLLQVNDINFENMSNDDAVRVLREIVHKPGPIILTVAKCWDPSPQGYFTLPRNEPIRPIDPAAWVSHSVAMTGPYPPYPGSSSLSTITSSSSVTETERFDDFNLSLHSDMASVAKAMASPESGLEVRDRMWLKITIPNAFLGSDVVEWLFHHIEGFQDRREARKYASNLLKAGFIRHTVNKITFSEQCYYVFGDLSDYMANLSLNDNDGSSGASDQDTLAPLPLPGASPWPMMHTFPYQPYQTHPYSSQPPPYHELSSYSYAPGSTGSQHSEGSRSSGSTRSEGERRRSSKGPGSTAGVGEKSSPAGEGGGADSRSGSGSESEYSTRSSLRRGHGSAAPSEHSHASSHRSLHHRMPAPPPHMSPYPPGILPYNPMMVMMVPQHPHPAMAAAHALPHTQQMPTAQIFPALPPPPSSTPGGPPGAPPTRDLGSVPPELTASRQSFHLAMGNPSEFFVDVM
uniref:Segment polarity protein dishevelled homolog DVL-2-like n=1 Tax=Gouania willdenowi TaxID=441366 RepID=A0A8C5ETZ0_GOUWI